MLTLYALQILVLLLLLLLFLRRTNYGLVCCLRSSIRASALRSHGAEASFAAWPITHPQGMTEKVNVQAFRCLHGTAPWYLAETIHQTRAVTVSAAVLALCRLSNTAACSVDQPTHSWRRRFSDYDRTRLELSAVVTRGHTQTLATFR